MPNNPIDPLANEDVTAWFTAFDRYLNNRYAGEAGLGVDNAGLDGRLAEAEVDCFDEEAVGLYGAPSTATIEQRLIAERAKKTGCSLYLIAKWTLQLNILEAFRKYLAVKRMDKSIYVKGTQAAATHKDGIHAAVKAAMLNQSPETGRGKPVPRKGGGRAKP